MLIRVCTYIGGAKDYSNNHRVKFVTKLLIYALTVNGGVTTERVVTRRDQIFHGLWIFLLHRSHLAFW